MRRELHIFFTALMFYTRIPCPKWVDHDRHYINLSVRYFPLIGWIVGIISFSFLWLGTSTLDSSIGVLLAIAASVLTTGAFHEDGFADVCDGFGGGWTKDKILMIMKDSRVGAYGVIGMILLISMKIILLIKLTEIYDMTTLCILFVVIHAMSRFMVSTLIYTHSYVRDDNDSKAKPVAGQVGFGNLVAGAFFGFIPLLVWVFWTTTLIYLMIPVTTYVAVFFLGKYFKKWIGGYTGDCLGAAQQVTEVVTIVTILVIWKFI